jgi:hypothetical protein
MLFTEIIPEMFQAAVEGKIKIDTETAEIKDVESVWNTEIPAGKRLVLTI